MFFNSTIRTSRLLFSRRLVFFCFSFTSLWLTPLWSHAHPSPNTLIFLDVSPERVTMEVQLPLPELELAFGHEVSKNPETLISRLGPEIQKYLAAHTHAYAVKGRPWRVAITGLRMDRGTYADSNIPYWEVVAQLVLQPPPGETTRKFMLDYDVIMHEVINHVALVSIRSDWEAGMQEHAGEAQASVIRRNVEDNKVHPLEISLEAGNWWKGFRSMLGLGMQHIKEGTDHLLFLIVLLLPSILLVTKNSWGKFGGIRYSFVRLLKIITAFTIGHSTTLLIGALGWLRLPAQPVEIMIAFSIFVSAVHAVYPVFPGKEMYVAAGFGLIHGLAFATVLANLHLGSGTLILSILGFNLGIELMQLCIVLIIIPWLIILGKTPFYKWVRIPGAILAAVAALAWIAERISGNANFITLFISGASPYGLWYIAVLAAGSVLVYLWYNYIAHGHAYQSKSLNKS